MSIEAKQQELEELRKRIATLEAEVTKAPTANPDWPPKEFYTAYYAMTGGVLGIFGAVVSLIVNVIGAPMVGKSPLELIKVYLTFPIGERALSLSTESEGLILTLGCCLYIGTGMLIGVPIYLVMSKICGTESSLGKRIIVGCVTSLAVWAIAFYGVLSWLQPALFGGNWITDPAVMPPWVAAGTHLIFGVTLAVLYPWGQFTAYRRHLVEPTANPEPTT